MPINIFIASIAQYGSLKIVIARNEAIAVFIFHNYTRSQALPGNAYPEALPPLSQPRLFKSDIGSEALPGNQLTSY